MHTVYIDSGSGERERLERLYAELLVFTPGQHDRALRLRPGDDRGGVRAYAPLEAQYHMPVEEWVGRFAPVKPAFIHHPRTKGLIRDILVEMGCDADETYMDVPRLRSVTSDGYLTSGVGYAHHPHRDTWYSAPMAQLNWWLPIYPFETELDGVPPPLLGRGRRERLGELQLLRVEHRSAARTPRSTSRATPASGPRPSSTSSSSRRCASSRRRRHRAVLRRPHALDRAEHVGAPGSASTSAR